MDEPTLETRLQNARELLRGYPEGTLPAAESYLRDRNSAAVDALLLGVLAHHLPPQPNRAPLTAQPGSARLMEDLGFDSLAMVEVHFLVKDLTGINIPEGELHKIRTLDDLRTLVRQHANVT